MDAIPRAGPLQIRAFETRLDALFMDIEGLPTLPTIVWEIQAQLQDPLNDAAQLALAIENDPSLTANVLRLANSAFYGASERFVNIKNAVIRIGRREIEHLVGALVIIDTFDELRGSMDYDAFWRHSLQAADAIEFLSAQHYTSSPFVTSEAYVSGLLHDIGKLILNYYFADTWADIRACADRYGRDDADAERATIGIDHGEVGARLLEAWGLQSSLVEGIRWHHQTLRARARYAAHAELVAFADSVCHLYERGELGTKRIRHPRFALDREQADLLAEALNRATDRANLILA